MQLTLAAKRTIVLSNERNCYKRVVYVQTLLTAKSRCFVRTVAAIVFAVAYLGMQYTQSGGFTLEFGFGTIPEARIFRRTTDLVAEVPAIAIAIAS